MIQSPENPLFKEIENPAVDLTSLDSSVVLKRKRSTHKRDIRDLRRAENAREILKGFTKGVEIYGFTKGQFSVIDILTAALDIIGKAELTISTWTASKTEVRRVLEFVDSVKLTSAKCLVDLSFQNRTPELAQKIREIFGAGSIRVGKNHAKFFLLENASWKIVCKTSMNLNFNPRFENFDIAHDPELFDFHKSIIAEIWQNQKKETAYKRPAVMERSFFQEM